MTVRVSGIAASAPHAVASATRDEVTAIAWPEISGTPAPPLKMMTAERAGVRIRVSSGGQGEASQMPQIAAYVAAHGAIEKRKPSRISG
jgi:hypothetical protein